MEDIQRHINNIMNEQNNRGILDFEGYSPIDMEYIFYDTFGKNSPVQLKKISDSDYQKIPILNQIKYLLSLLFENKEIKLTKKGFLPTKIVADIYNQKFLKDELIELGISKLYKESDCMNINLTRILIDIAGLTKKQYGKLSLTKIGKKVASDNYELLKTIFITFGSKFNWAYYDGYGENRIGQLGYGFSLILLNKYGHIKRLDKFYAEKYFKAFPKLLNGSENSTLSLSKDDAAKCFSLRTFDRFLVYFGLIKIESSVKNWDADKYIIKTELFDKLIKVRHNI